MKVFDEDLSAWAYASLEQCRDVPLPSVYLRGPWYERRKIVECRNSAITIADLQPNCCWIYFLRDADICKKKNRRE